MSSLGLRAQVHLAFFVQMLAHLQSMPMSTRLMLKRLQLMSMLADLTSADPQLVLASKCLAPAHPQLMSMSTTPVIGLDTLMQA